MCIRDRDEDVIEAGNLVGLSCSGQFRIQTAFFSAGTYNTGVPLTYDSTSGNVIPTTVGAGSGAPILGDVVIIRGPEAIGLQGSPLSFFPPAQDSSAPNANENVVIFDTRYDPANA